MTIDPEALRSLLCERLCEDVAVENRPDGELMLRTHFAFPDGDGFPFTCQKPLRAAFDCRTTGTRSCTSATSTISTRS